MNKGSANIALFLIGLFALTQIHVMGSIGISELVIFMLAPFVFLSTYNTLRVEGFLTIVWLSLLACLGCLVGSWLAGTHPLSMMKGIASPYAVFACTVVFHSLLRKNLNGLKWVLLGFALSKIVNIFVFQPETDVVRGGVKLEGDAAIALVTGGVLFWSTRVSTFLTLPIRGWYLQMPTWYSALAPLFVGIFYLLYSGGSGRSAALALFLSAAFLVMGRKSRKRMRSVKKHLLLTLTCMVLVVLTFSVAYRFAAPKGLLGEDVQKKYERIDDKAQKSIIGLLISGRLHTFTGLRACFDKPIMGFGAKAIDIWGYTEEMLDRYGNAQDYENYKTASMKGLAHVIPAHSHIVAGWLDDGILGLLMWCYILYLIYRFFAKCTDVIPQWYGYFAITIPGAVWDIFFSPFGGRVEMGLLVTCLLLVMAIRRGRLQIPDMMEYETFSHAH